MVTSVVNHWVALFELFSIRRKKTELNMTVKGYATQVPELGTEMCAVVEFASDESAMAACKTFHHSATENGTAASRGMRVALLGPRLKRNLYGNR